MSNKTLIDARDTILWLERRISPGYGNVPHVKRTIAALDAAIAAAGDAAAQPQECEGKRLFREDIEKNMTPLIANLLGYPRAAQQQKLVYEQEQKAAADAYFKARWEGLDTLHNRRVFEAGFERGYSTAPQLAQEAGQARELPPLPSAGLWMTHESRRRLSQGGNCKGSVPVHGKRSATATLPLYTADQMREYARAAQPAPAVPEGWKLVPTDLNSVVNMGWVYLDKAREESPLKEWAFSPAGFIAAIAAAPSTTTA